MNLHQFAFDMIIRAKKGYTTHVWQEKAESVIEALSVDTSLIFIMVGSEYVALEVLDN